MKQLFSKTSGSLGNHCFSILQRKEGVGHELPLLIPSKWVGEMFHPRGSLISSHCCRTEFGRPIRLGLERGLRSAVLGHVHTSPRVLVRHSGRGFLTQSRGQSYEVSRGCGGARVPPPHDIRVHPIPTHCLHLMVLVNRHPRWKSWQFDPQ